MGITNPAGVNNLQLATQIDAMSKSKYAWHPQTRPPPADQSIAERIAAIGPVGKCLETALHELLMEDCQQKEEVMVGSEGTSQMMCDTAEDCETNANGMNSSHITGRKRKQPTGYDDARDMYAKKYPSSEVLNEGASESSILNSNSNNKKSIIRLDNSMVKSILESYSKAVSITKFDQEKKIYPGSTSSDTITSSQHTNPRTTTEIIAPAAILKGDIDHYNRIGGQWRIVVKNAILKPRSLTRIDNGMTGRSFRTRTVLDWDNNDGSEGTRKKESALESSAKSGRNCANDKETTDYTAEDDDSVHHFRGTIQILAYDDTT